jgi:hypothetical protein
MVGKYVTNVERSIKMKRDELKLIYKLVDDYADIVKDQISFYESDNLDTEVEETWEKIK